MAVKLKLLTFLGNMAILTPFLLKLPIVPKYLEKSDKFNSADPGTRTLIPFIGLLLRFLTSKSKILRVFKVQIIADTSPSRTNPKSEIDISYLSKVLISSGISSVIPSLITVIVILLPAPIRIKPDTIKGIKKIALSVKSIV